MNFSDRMEKLFELLECSNAEIAKRANIHPSGVSRFRRGERIPTARNNQFLKVCGGVVLYAEERALTDRLRELCGLPDHADSDRLSMGLATWLLADSAVFGKHTAYSGKPVGKFFADKLDALMTLLDTSNVRLASAVNVDTSLISRLRNRVRPPSGNEIVRSICEYLYVRAVMVGPLPDFCRMTGLSEGMATGDREASIAYLCHWISDKDFEESNQVMDTFLSGMDTFIHDAFPPLPPLDVVAPQAVLREETDCYYGIDGLRRAVVRFLGNAAKAETPGTLLLYSDQSTEWMNGDPAYTKIWAALMVYTLRARNRIKIIHNINRGLPEMLQAITNWLPLYFSGLLESWYHKKGSDGRFYHTLFLSDAGAVVANVVSGLESEGEYRYITGDGLAYYKRQYEGLMDSSHSLVRMFVPGDQKGLLFLLGEMARQPGESQKLLSTLSFETMSKKTLDKILRRTKPDRETAQKIRDYHKEKRAVMESEIRSGGVCEYVFLPEDGLLFSGEIPLSMGDLFLGELLFYTPEEYASHLADIMALLEQSDAYQFVPIMEKPFESLQLYVKRDVGVVVMKSGDAPVASSFGHPLMASAYMEYVAHIGQRSAVTPRSRGEIVALLRKYTV